MNRVALLIVIGLTKKNSTLTMIMLVSLVSSCMVMKDDRILKRKAKEWREASIVLRAYADTPFSGIFLTLRENGRFEHESSGLIKSFEAGTWTKSQDTIKLEYLDYKQNVKRNQDVIIDGQTATFIFEKDSTAVDMRLRIMVNERF